MANLKVFIDENTLTLKIGNTYYQFSLDCVESEGKRLSSKINQKQLKTIREKLSKDLR